MSDAYLLDIGWLFLAAWAIVVAIVSIEAFGQDLFPPRTQPHPPSAVPKSPPER